MNTSSNYFLILLCFFSTFFYGQNNLSANQGYAEPAKYLTTIPYEEIKEKIIIDVVVNNKTRKFIFDTGATMVISENLYNELNTETLGTVKVIDSSNFTDSLNIVLLPEIKLNDVVFKDTPTIVSKDIKLIFECFGIEGFIGSNLLRNSVVQFDSENKVIILSDSPKPLNLKRKYSQKMDLSSFQSNPFIKIKLKKGKSVATEKILFDTGADGLYEMSVNAYNQVSEQLEILELLAESHGTFSMGLHGNAENSDNYAVTIPSLEINKLTLNNLVAKTTYSENSRIGSEILKYGKATLNYKNKRFYFEPYGNASKINPEKELWGIDPIMKDEKIVVGIIWDKNLEDKINVGDEILKIEDMDYQNMDFCQKVRESRKINKEKALIVLKDVETGVIKNVEIQKL